MNKVLLNVGFLSRIDLSQYLSIVESFPEFKIRILGKCGVIASGYLEGDIVLFRTDKESDETVIICSPNTYYFGGVARNMTTRVESDVPMKWIQCELNLIKR